MFFPNVLRHPCYLIRVNWSISKARIWNQQPESVKIIYLKTLKGSSMPYPKVYPKRISNGKGSSKMTVSNVTIFLKYQWFFFRDDFLWCYSVYSSRSFPYTLIDPSSTETSEVLFPLVDALNHKPNTKITWSRNGDIKNGSLSFIAGEAFENGVEIFNNYGPKVSKDLFGYVFMN